MNRGSLELARVPDFLSTVPLYRDFNARFFRLESSALAELVVEELERAGAVQRTGGLLRAA